jgi:DNA polymerase-4
MGEMLSTYARGEDQSPVGNYYETSDVKSVSNGMTFRRDISTADEIRHGLSVLSEEIGERLRRRGLRASTVGVTVKDPVLRTLTRQRAISPPTDLGREIAALAERIVLAEYGTGKPIRMLTVSAMNLVAGDEGDQLSLFGEPEVNRHERTGRLEETVDSIRTRFGAGAVVRGAVLGNDLGIHSGEENEKDKK